MRSRLTAAAALAISLLATTAAQAATYDVTGTGDVSDPFPCSELAPGSGAYQCSTLRRAVTEANQNPGGDGIFLHGGTYAMTFGELTVTDSVIVAGENARTTVIQGGTSTRVLSTRGAANVQLTNLTIQGGSASSATGGSILVDVGTTLSLVFARVTGGSAFAGGGIGNSGTVAIQNSLIDHNVGSSAGGGILNDGSVDAPARLTVIDSTIAANRVVDGPGGGIRSEGNAGNQVQLVWATLARNISGGLSLDSDQNVSASGSIFAANSGPNCEGVSFSSAQSNVEDTATCGMDPGTNKVGSGQVVAAELSNQGGPTDVLTIPDRSPAIDYVNPCFIQFDQRNFQRVSSPDQPCDAGANELSGTEIVVQPPPPPPPTPTPTPAPTATPVPAGSVGVDEVAGTVLIRDPKTKKFVPFDEKLLKTGAELDTREGTVEITNPAGEKAKFFDGVFKLSLTKNLTTLTLSEVLDCKKAKRKARAAAKKPKTRQLWGDGKGKFRTKGSYSAATVRGTKWLVKDTCTTTLTDVRVGTVLVDDLVMHKKITLRAKKTYTARAKGR